MNIAIIGSGISGLVAAYRLHRNHSITVFEANDYVGGHANTASVEVAGKSYEVDTGFIVFNDWTYPNFIRLLDELNVVSHPTEMSFSVRDEPSGLEYNGHNLNTLFAQRRNLFRPRFYRMVYDIGRFNRIAKSLTGEQCGCLTVGDFLDQGNFSAAFRNHYLLPMGSAIWSCPTGVFADFPLGFIVEFYQNHGLLNLGDRPTWRVIEGGSQTYVAALSQGFAERIRLNSPVRRVSRTNGLVEVSTDQGDQNFDHVIFACHSDQALKILGKNATVAERDLLTKFPYSRSVAVLHTDETVLPKNRRAWASWNYQTADANSSASVTYNMSLLQGIESPHTFCVTLNGESQVNSANVPPIDRRKILERYVYHHPVFTVERAAAQARHGELINVNQTSFCGAYWRNGFHEDGVVSAIRVVDALDSEVGVWNEHRSIVQGIGDCSPAGLTS
jgi:predicted NAD/FAD-binding protein